MIPCLLTYVMSSSSKSYILKMETANYFETLVTVYQSTRPIIPEYLTLALETLSNSIVNVTFSVQTARTKIPLTTCT